MRHRARNQAGRRQAAATRYRQRSMACLRRKITHRNIAACRSRADDAELRYGFAALQFRQVIKPPSRFFSPINNPASLHRPRIACMKSASASSSRNGFLRRLAELAGQRDHHRHGHIHARDRIAVHGIARRAGRQQLAGLVAHWLVQEQVDGRKAALHAGNRRSGKAAIARRAMREVVTTPVLVLRIAISCMPMAGASITPVSRPHSCRLDDILPQFTLQSISPCSLASCASVLTRRGRPSCCSTSARNTLLLVGVPRPRPVTCRLPALAPRQRHAHQVAQQFVAQQRLFRHAARVQHQPGRGAAAQMVHGILDARRSADGAENRAGRAGWASWLAVGTGSSTPVCQFSAARVGNCTGGLYLALHLCLFIYRKLCR